MQQGKHPRHSLAVAPRDLAMQRKDVPVNDSKHRKTTPQGFAEPVPCHVQGTRPWLAGSTQRTTHAIRPAPETHKGSYALLPDCLLSRSGLLLSCSKCIFANTQHTTLQNTRICIPCHFQVTHYGLEPMETTQPKGHDQQTAPCCPPCTNPADGQ